MLHTIQPKASHFINGEYIEDTNGEKIDIIYPANGSIIGTVYSATQDIIDYALQSAQESQKIWESMTGMERGRILRHAAEHIREHNQSLSTIETYDTGKPIQETIVADATSGADALEYFASVAPTITGDHIPLADGDFVYTIRQALGVCVGIGAWNYPTQIACWKMAIALACGNSIVFKPSENTPIGALHIAEILHKAGLPKGVCNVIQGYGNVGEALAKDSRVAKVSLTGSVSTGQKVYATAAQGMKHVTMELGGKSPLIIFDDADIDNAVSGIILGNFYSSGQICSNGTRVFIHKDIYQKCVDALIARMQNIHIGDPLDQSVNFGPLVSQQQLDNVQRYVDIGIGEGAHLAYGGKRITKGDLAKGFYIEPTIFTNVNDTMTIAKEEIFGPVASLLDFSDENEVLERANNTAFGLASGVFTKDITRAHRVAAKLQAGICYINTYNNSPVEAPFGGTKLSGIGRENSKAAIEHYSERKTVYVALNNAVSPY